MEHSINFERRLLRILLIEEGSYERLRRVVDLNLFSDKSHVLIFRVLKAYYEKYLHLPDDEALLISFQKSKAVRRANLDADTLSGIVQKIKNLPDEDAGRADFLVDTLTGYKEVRIIQRSLDKCIKNLETEDIKGAKESLEEAVSEVSETENEVDAGDYSADFIARRKKIEVMRKHPEKFQGLPTGIPALDARWQGLIRGRLAIMLGAVGKGKSMFLMEVAYSNAIRGKRVVHATIEMTKEEIQYRLDSRLTGIPASRFETASLNEEEFKTWEERMKWFNEHCGFYEVVGFPKGSTVSMIEMKLKEIYKRKKQPIDLLVVDYLNDLKPVGRFQSSKSFDAQGEISWDLHLLAKGWNKSEGLAIWTACQVTRQSQNKTELELTDLSLSQLPANHADVVFYLAKDGNKMKVGMAKNRHGKTVRPVIIKPNFEVMRLDSGELTDEDL